MEFLFQRTFTISKQLKMTHTKTGRPFFGEVSQNKDCLNFITFISVFEVAHAGENHG